MARFSIYAIILVLTLFGTIHASYYTYINAPAVITNTSGGVLTKISLNLTAGNGTVVVLGPKEVGQNTNQSAIQAAAVASQFTGMSENKFNFNYFIATNDTDVSGPSAGLAMTLLAVSALRQMPLMHNFAVTGTINPDGTVGLIGGAYEKSGAAAYAKMRMLLVPATQNGSTEDAIYYIAQQRYNIPLVEVSNVSTALPYAFQNSSVKFLTYNVSQNYYTSGLPEANLQCNDCNTSTFDMLTNFTLTNTQNEINNLTGNFSNLKSQFASQLNQYSTIANKGYLYTAADFSFLQYINAYMFVHSANISTDSVSVLLQNTAATCNSLTPAPLTDRNYEYVTGGSMRQTLGNITINQAAAELNNSQTSDGLLPILQSIAEANAWCNAASKMYSIASSIGGNYIAYSPQLKQTAYAELTNQTLGTSIYDIAAKRSYNSGDYAAVLYELTYNNAFAIPTNLNTTGMASGAMAVLKNESSFTGIWPNQFAVQSSFYLYQYNSLSTNTSKASNANSAYSSALLASGISSANHMLTSMFISNSTSAYEANLQQQIGNLQNQVVDLQIAIAIMFLLLILTVLFIFKLTRKNVRKTSRRRRA